MIPLFLTVLLAGQGPADTARVPPQGAARTAWLPRLRRLPGVKSARIVQTDVLRN